ncbi:MAG: hypothetical protein ACI81R_000059 [Bradymonadia bacterium]|jgi:hypothetical protein
MIPEPLVLSRLVTSVTRLLWCAFAGGTDQALQLELSKTESAAKDLTATSMPSATILYCERGIYVNEALWDADEAAYRLALRIGSRLRRSGFNLVSIGSDVTVDDLRLMLHALNGDATEAVQDSTRATYSAAARLRSVAHSLVDDDHRPTAHSRGNASYLYASAVVQCRTALRALNRDAQFEGAALEVVGHRIVQLVLETPDTALALTRIQIDEVATRAVNTALLAVSACRQVTTDVVSLRRVALASLMLESGVARVAATYRGGEQPDLHRLSDEQAGQVPAATAAAVALLGWLEPKLVGRAVCAFEAAWRIVFGHTDDIYRDGEPPRFESLLIWAAWRFNLIVSSVSIDGRRCTPDAAAAALNSATNNSTERRAVLLLLRALGLVPRGTVVRLASGALGLVVANAVSAEHFGLPVVELYETANAEPVNDVVLDFSRPDETLAEWGGIAAVLRSAVAPESKLESLRALDASDAAAAPAFIVARRPAYTPLDLHAVTDAGPSKQKAHDEASAIAVRERAEDDLDTILASYFDSPSASRPVLSQDSVKRAEHRLIGRREASDATEQLTDLLSDYLDQTGAQTDPSDDSQSGVTTNPHPDALNSVGPSGMRDTLPEMGVSAAEILHAHLSSVSQAGAADDLMDTGELPKAHSNESELTQDVPALSREIADQRLLDAARESANAKRADSGAESNRHLDPAQAPAPAQTPANRDSSAQANNEAAPPIEEE